MKVGFDACLLGAWASVPDETNEPLRVLDVGTGTGVIALMLAQRYPHASITAIDIDEQAVAQARRNVAESPFSERIDILPMAFEDFAKGRCETDDRFHAIVSNPPFFQPERQALLAPDTRRAVARHDTNHLVEHLLLQAPSMLVENGRLSLILPSESRQTTIALARNLHLRSCVDVFTSPRREQPKRSLLSFSPSPCEHPAFERLDTRDLDGNFTDDYQDLLRPFYLHL